MAALLARIGRFSARHRWVVIPAWLIALLLAGLVALVGMKFADGAFDVPGTNSSEAMATMEKKFGEQEQAPSLQLVIESSAGPVGDHVAEIDAAIEKLERLPFVDAVSSPFDPAMPYISEDLSTAVATVSFYTMDAPDAATATAGVDDVAASLRASGEPPSRSEAPSREVSRISSAPARSSGLRSPSSFC